MNEGVEEAPDAILTPEFLHEFTNSSVSAYEFPLPETVEKPLYAEVIAKQSVAFAEQINAELKPSEVQVVIGGDHSVTFSTFLALQKRIDFSKMAYIQFDSHADINNFASSPTGNFHGIYVRPFVTDIDNPAIGELVQQKMIPENMLYIGNLDLDPEEQKLFVQKHIRNYNRKDIETTRPVAKTAIEELLKLPHVHVTFDVDMFDHSLVSATGIPAPEGLFYEDIEEFLQMIAKHPSISIDLVEINPRKTGAQEAIQLAQKVLLQLLA